MSGLRQLSGRKVGLVHGWLFSLKNFGVHLSYKGSKFKEYLDSLLALFSSHGFLYSHCRLEKKSRSIKVDLFLNDWRFESYLLSRLNLNVTKYRYIVEYLSERRFIPNIIHADLYGRLAMLERVLVKSGTKFFNYPVEISYKFLDESVVNSALIGAYIKVKLEQGDYLKSILNRLGNHLDKLCKKGEITGYYIVCKGRFSKASRSSQLRVSGGFQGFSNANNNIEYSEVSIVLKYGLLSVSVWVLKNKLCNFSYKVKV